MGRREAGGEGVRQGKKIGGEGEGGRGGGEDSGTRRMHATFEFSATLRSATHMRASVSRSVISVLRLLAATKRYVSTCSRCFHALPFEF